MICRPCKAAGAIALEARQGRGQPPGNSIFLLMMAAERHQDCKWPASCACQHRVPKPWRKT